jgi:hypothetical protein
MTGKRQKIIKRFETKDGDFIIPEGWHFLQVIEIETYPGQVIAARILVEEN